MISRKEKIDLILNKYAKINGEIQDNFRKELDASMKEFRKGTGFKPFKGAD